MTTITRQSSSVTLDTPVRNARSSSQTAAPTLFGRVIATIRKDPLVVFVGIWDAIFYGSLIALLAYL